MGLKLSGGSTSVADEELPEHVQRPLKSSHAFFEATHAGGEVSDLLLQPVQPPFQAAHVLPRHAMQVEHNANNDGGGIH